MAQMTRNNSPRYPMRKIILVFWVDPSSLELGFDELHVFVPKNLVPGSIEMDTITVISSSVPTMS